MININKIKGFNLVELAIVLAVIALFMGGAINTYTRWFEKQQYEQAISDIEIIKKAIIGYAMTNGYLPCPDISNAIDGNEARGVGGACEALGGNDPLVPFNTLGLKQVDPWGVIYFYRAHSDYTDSNNLFELDNTNGLNIDDGNDIPIANNVAFVVYSLGPDQGRRFTIEQEENRDFSNQTFSKPLTFLPYSNNSTPADNSDDTGYDDVFSWVSTNVLKYHLVEADQLPRPD